MINNILYVETAGYKRSMRIQRKYIEYRGCTGLRGYIEYRGGYRRDIG